MVDTDPERTDRRTTTPNVVDEDEGWIYPQLKLTTSDLEPMGVGCNDEVKISVYQDRVVVEPTEADD